MTAKGLTPSHACEPCPDQAAASADSPVSEGEGNCSPVIMVTADAGMPPDRQPRVGSNWG